MPARAPRVLVIYKKSAYQVYVTERRNQRISELLERGDPAVSKLRGAHDAHMAALEQTRSLLQQLGARAEYRTRGHRGEGQVFDLVVTLGGDGTLLWASHALSAATPVVAINTAPDHSVGYFAAATAAELGDTLRSALCSELPVTQLQRMTVWVDDVVLTHRVLNEALFSHACPAATTRYIVRVGDRVEEQKSSGIWVGPAAGSTGAQRSAGGRVLAPGSRHLQYIVREPYLVGRRSYGISRGLLKPGQELEVRNKMRSAHLYIDGPRILHEMEMGSVLRFAISNDPLSLLGFQRRPGGSGTAKATASEVGNEEQREAGRQPVTES